MMDCYAFKFNREKYNHCKNALVKRIKRNGPQIAKITSLDLLFSSRHISEIPAPRNIEQREPGTIDATTTTVYY